MEFEEILARRRTIRLFQQRQVCEDDLKKLLNAARLSSCAANMQRLRYVVINAPEDVKFTLEHSAWAAKVKPNRNPEWGKTAPAAFLAVLAPVGCGTIIHADAGAAIQAMEFQAFDLGLGCCWLASFDKAAMTARLALQPALELLYLVAVGYPAEQPVAEDVSDLNKISYYLDDQNLLHVPKLTVEALIAKEKNKHE